MDPNNPGQNSGAPTPDPWAAPQAPGQAPYPQQPPTAPTWGAPAAGFDPNQPPAGFDPNQPPAGFDPNQPPAGQPPYGQPYGQQPYGQPAWGVPAAPATKSKLPRIVGLVVGIVVVLIIGLVVLMILAPNHAGKVIFTTDAPTSDGAKTCQLGTQVTSVAQGAPVYANYFFSKKLGNDVVTLTVIKDGAVLGSDKWPAGQASGLNCLEDTSNLNSLPAGTYEFKLTLDNGDVVSDGTLTVK